LLVLRLVTIGALESEDSLTIVSAP